MFPISSFVEAMFYAGVRSFGESAKLGSTSLVELPEFSEESY